MVTDPSIVGMWLFDSHSAVCREPLVADESPRKHNGVMSGTTRSWRGRKFATSGLVNCGYSPDFLFSDAQTIAAYIRVPNTAIDGYVFAKVQTAFVYYLQIGSVANYFRYSIAGGMAACIGGATNPYLGQWIVVVCTWDASITTRKIYINGSLRGTDTSSGSVNTNTDAFTIGNRYSGSYGFGGDVGWVIAYKRCLSASEIARITPSYAADMIASRRRVLATLLGSTYYGSAVLTGLGQLDPKGIRVALGSALLDGAATLTADGIRVALGSATIDGAGSIDAAGIRVALAAAALDASGALDVNGIRVALGQALLNGQADITPNGSIIASASAIFNASADLQAAGRKVSITFTGDTINFLFPRDVADFTFDRDTVRFNTP